VRDLGIDEFAFRSGGWFGTILVDLERHRIIDLLPDRQAETAEQWMRQHPTIRAVSRDRGGEYAKAARLGAPQAVQIADRFHSVKNLTEATQRLLERCQAELLAASQTEEPAGREPPTAIRSLQEWRPLEPAQVKQVRLARRAGRLARYEQVRALLGQGVSSKEIAQRLSLSDRTVQRWQAAKVYPEVKRRRKRRSAFDAFAPEVLKRWQAGEHNGQALLQAIKAQGYTGSKRTVYRSLEPLKQAEVRANVNPHRLEKFSAKTAVWLFVRDPATLDEVEQEDLAAWCQVSPILKQTYRLVQEFLVMVHKREGQHLDARAREGGKQRPSRTPVLCLWGRARQGSGASRLNFRPQQCPNRGQSDQSQAHQATNVRAGRICEARANGCCMLGRGRPTPLR
jgi:transposase